MSKQKSIAFWKKLVINIAGSILSLLVVGSVSYYLYNQWQEQNIPKQSSPKNDLANQPPDGTMPARLSADARRNLGLTTQPAIPTQYYRKIEIPGMVVDRPGVSDRGVVAPVAGVVTKIYSYPGMPVVPGSRLFSLRIVSDSIHSSQLELFKATKEIEIAEQQKKRLEGLAASGGVPGSRMIELDNEIQRMQVNVQAYFQNLIARGLTEEQIDAAARGDFVTEIDVYAPTLSTLPAIAPFSISNVAEDDVAEFQFELQTLSVSLGQQVEAGAILCLLADHRSLMIEGRGFKKDLAAIQHAARERLPTDVVFESSQGRDWPQHDSIFFIEHLANVIDPNSRTFGFFLPLENQWQAFTQNEQQRLLWRYRPGDRVRILVAVELLENVFVLPISAVAREGAEAFVFRQNGDLFDRISVHIVCEDSQSVVIANDGRLRRNAYLAQNGAASINRILKAQLSSGQPTNLHVHADGTVHAH